MGILSSTETPPSPAASEGVGPKAKSVIAAINQAGIKSSNADRAAKTITANNIANFFPVVVSSITAAAMQLMTCTELLSGMSPDFSAAEQNEIYDAFKGYAQIHGQFIASVVDKHGIVGSFPGCMFIGSCFLANKTCVGAFTFRVVALLPTRADDAKSQQEALDRSLDHAVDVFGP
ncbi:hypothetical protein SLS64_011322 [Diaporthe eres]|uniref:Uncharacterized protein n=1 Tax=Diaporthe eres TaxID=83184 RepID=A0ABR1NNQ7_DIAER